MGPKEITGISNDYGNEFSHIVNSILADSSLPSAVRGFYQRFPDLKPSDFTPEEQAKISHLDDLAKTASGLLKPEKPDLTALTEIAGEAFPLCYNHERWKHPLRYAKIKVGQKTI